MTRTTYRGPPKTIWLYQVPPLDLFDGVMTIEEMATRADVGLFSERNYKPFGGALSPLELYLVVSREARERWGDDEVAAGPFVMPLPLGEPNLGFLLLWKHSHAGTTYIASPIRLHHLENHGCWFTMECRHGQAVSCDDDASVVAIR
jgi:hypothetical protein